MLEEVNSIWQNILDICLMVYLFADAFRIQGFVWISTSPDEDFQLIQKIIYYNYFSHKNNFDKISLYSDKTWKSNALENKETIKHISFFRFTFFYAQALSLSLLHTHTHTHIYIYIYMGYKKVLFVDSFMVRGVGELLGSNGIIISIVSDSFFFLPH